MFPSMLLEYDTTLQLSASVSINMQIMIHRGGPIKLKKVDILKFTLLPIQKLAGRSSRIHLKEFSIVK